ncbi:hypothetical protein NOCARDAX2BIS_110040 [Nocardioides sp. AX2bis]|nr:hypothetical protein NOCARDAX2BIS_110040 [Nocardioides sp. AX2bis]
MLVLVGRPLRWIRVSPRFRPRLACRPNVGLRRGAKRLLAIVVVQLSGAVRRRARVVVPVRPDEVHRSLLAPSPEPQDRVVPGPDGRREPTSRL